METGNGELDVSIGYVRLIDQEKAALRGVTNVQGGGHVGAMTGAIVATQSSSFPAAPHFLLIHGNGHYNSEWVLRLPRLSQGDLHLDMAKFALHRPENPSDTAIAPAAPQSSLPNIGHA